MDMEPILFYRCLSILDINTQMWTNETIPYQNIIVLLMKCYVVISEFIIIKKRNLFLQIYSIKIEQSIKMPREK